MCFALQGVQRLDKYLVVQGANSDVLLEPATWLG